MGRAGWPVLRWLMLGLATVGLVAAGPGPAKANSFPVPRIEWKPETYVCYRAGGSIQVDGRLDEAGWRDAAWTDEFVDIEGDLRPRPRFRTRAKMLWDDEYFYVAAEMEEPHVWAKLRERDSVIYHDNDFEVFIDPDGDNHEYYELEINAFGTEWDLLLTRPYRDDGAALHAWDIRGLQTAVSIDGSLNRSDDEDRGWQVEIAFPWEILRECSHRPTPPEPGDQWRVNFSRVQWRTRIENGLYVKEINPSTKKPLPEDNWVWSPQGLIAMHYPEMWGFVQFSGHPHGGVEETVSLQEEDRAKWALMQLYYRQKEWHRRHGSYTTDLSKLGVPEVELETYKWPPVIYSTIEQYEARLENEDGRVIRVNHVGHLW